jgi:ankyrin repeat protein
VNCGISKEALTNSLTNTQPSGAAVQSIKPIYIVALVAVILLAVTVKIMNPHKKYSTKEFWNTASLESVQQVPEEAMKKGNKNGGVLMWAAIGSSDPSIIKALVARGADVNERDGIFSGTPLTGAAGYNKNPAVITELINLGANMKMTVNNGDTPLMIAAMFNTNPGIIEVLVSHGADVNDKNLHGETALYLARSNDNKVAEKALSDLMAVK